MNKRFIVHKPGIFPIELKYIVLSYVNKPSLSKCSYVCKEWNYIVGDEWFQKQWKRKNIMKITRIFTDGGCINNGKKNARGGYGVYIGPDHNLNISKPLTDDKPTNNKGELSGILEGLMLVLEYSGVFKDKVIIYTDSEYSYNVVTKWVTGWQRKGWKTANGKPVKNKGLIQDIMSVLGEIKKDVSFEHVRSHQKEPRDKTSLEYILWRGNDMADRLATAGICNI